MLSAKICFVLQSMQLQQNLKGVLLLSIDHSESTYVSAAAHLKDFLSVVVR